MGLGSLAGARPLSALEFWLKIFVVIQRAIGSLDSVLLLSLFVYLFILKESGAGQREREREPQGGSPLSTQSPARGSASWTVRSRPELRSRARGLIR